VVDGQPVPVADIGGVACDVADRLAIINLFGAYAYAHDQNRLDDFRACSLSHPSLACGYTTAPRCRRAPIR